MKVDNKVFIVGVSFVNLIINLMKRNITAFLGWFVAILGYMQLIHNERCRR